MIIHTVVFNLKYVKGSVKEKKFFDAVGQLATIPGVQHFTILRQVNPATPFDLGLSMEFASLELYTQYTKHSDHTYFVHHYWKLGVVDFMEIDYEPLSKVG